MQWGLIIVVAIRPNSIGHNKTSLGFVTFLMMSCVNILFDNEGFRITTFM